MEFKESEFEKMVNPYNPLYGKLDRVIEYFVNYFGEENRTAITSTLKDTQFIFARRGKDADKDSIKLYFDECILKVLDLFKAELESKGIFSYRFLDTPLAVSGLNKLDKWKKRIEKEEIAEAFNLLCHYTDLGITEEQQLLEVINDEKESQKLYAFLNDLNEIYKSGYKSRIDQLLKTKYEKTEKPFQEFTFEKTKDFIAGWRMGVAEKVLSMFQLEITKENYTKVIDFSKSFVEMMIEESELRESKNYFTVLDKLFEISNEKEKHENFDEMSLTEQTTIKKNLLMRVKEAMPTQFISEYNEIMSKIYRGKNGYNRTLNYLRKNFSEGNFYICKSTIQRHESLAILDDAEAIHYTRGDFSGKFFKGIVAPSAERLTDDVLIHEMCHACQDRLVKCDEKICKVKTGAIVKTDYLMSDKTTFNDLTNLNEVINEYFTLKILEKLKQDNFAISPSSESFNCKYRKAFPFLKDFLDENEKLLKQCVMSSDEQAFEKVFGIVNMIQLNVVIGEIFDYIPAKGVSFDRAVKNGELSEQKNKIENIIKGIKLYQQEIKEEIYL